MLQQTVQLVHLNEDERAAREASEKASQEAFLANKKLEVKNKELEHFAFMASHDLQEPLRTTARFIELLQQQYKGRFDQKADKYLAFISDASERMKILIKDLLDFSRIGTKNEMEQLDCNQIIKTVIEDLMVAIKESNASIQCDELPVFIGYSTEIKLLFQNLLINAIKFRQPGTAPSVNISVKQNNDYWQFAVSDNGIGIEKTQSEKIFEIFQRLHARSAYDGSGIGLSHCKKIVELHQGKIWVESIPGAGSTFYFTILIQNKPQGVKSGS
ncbi:MAG: GHKL domain-containing protein [Gloeobacteraceae cyanobacterium ES-bin-316]|nr:GHKL domain-containing protein [Ferruginibacter sp.]